MMDTGHVRCEQGASEGLCGVPGLCVHVTVCVEA